MKLQKDIREFVELLLSRKVDFLLVGGFALAFHGAPRFTEDIDFFILASPENAARMAAVVAEFGFSELGLGEADFLVVDQVIQLGRAPHRIDLLTGISGVSWEEAWASRVAVNLDGLAIQVIGKAALEANKAATGRPQDLADLARLRNGKA
ncbi:nucleotidyl transferase AbiEii/AbiGii toxin family protein [Haloferula sp. BvORR071]|uniref:nucleotidyl transferase AbiEii/AbiGii toxin family protein n=1 Tax=Haloferula sp. BvORR071 TaxID=1396141 RepID=UPI000558754B|nr:nucleotidyl transferase AbiEii/AbiGii toxin family protein [Haloferula sp. BvORR071]